jgi:hypothetical protein
LREGVEFELKLSAALFVLIAIFNASAKLVDREMEEWSGKTIKRFEWSQRWTTVQRYIQAAYNPRFGSTLSFVAGLLFQNAYQIEAKVVVIEMELKLRSGHRPY